MSAQSAIFNPSQTTSAATGDGFSVPRLTTTGRLAITFGTADKGMMVFDTTLNNLFIWNGTAWTSVPDSGDSTDTQVIFNDNGVLVGDAGLVYNKTTDALTVAGNVILSTSGKGIDFSATPGIGTSELLADYEEGIWTPSLATDNVDFTSVSYIERNGQYTKVGRLVTFCGTIYTNGVVIGAASGNVTITGLPFQQGVGINGVLCYTTAVWGSDSPTTGQVDNYRILLLKRPTTLGIATGTQLLAISDVGTGGANNFLRFNGQYYV